MILIPSVLAERAAGVNSRMGRLARWNESHSPSRHWSVKVAPFDDGTKIVGVVPAKTPSVVRPNNDGRSTMSDNWQTQREIRTIRLQEADMLAKEHARWKPLGNVSGAGNNFCSAEIQTPVNVLTRHAESAS